MYVLSVRLSQGSSYQNSPTDRARYFGTAKKELLSGHLRVGSDAAQRATALRMRMHCSSARVHEHAAMRSFAELLCTLVSVVCVLC